MSNQTYDVLMPKNGVPIKAWIRGVSIEEVGAALIDEFAVVFGREMVPPDRDAAAGRRPAAGDGRPSIREAS